MYQKGRKTGLCLSILTCALIATGANAALNDGVYETTAKGNNGDVVMKTTIQAGKITTIEVVKSQETPMLGDKAIERLTHQIIAQQSVGLDVVSGATNSSQATLACVKAALVKAGGSE